MKRAFFILSMSISAVLASHQFGMNTAGGLCTLVLSFTAGTGWSKEKVNIFIHHFLKDKITVLFTSEMDI